MQKALIPVPFARAGVVQQTVQLCRSASQKLTSRDLGSLHAQGAAAAGAMAPASREPGRLLLQRRHPVQRLKVAVRGPAECCVPIGSTGLYSAALLLANRMFRPDATQAAGPAATADSYCHLSYIVLGSALSDGCQAGLSSRLAAFSGDHGSAVLQSPAKHCDEHLQLWCFTARTLHGVQRPARSCNLCCKHALSTCSPYQTLLHSAAPVSTASVHTIA